MTNRVAGTVHPRKQRAATYTPAWTSSGTAPALGNGTLTAVYVVDGWKVSIILNLTIGSTSTMGTGQWSFSLPIPAHTTFVQSIGGYAVDVSGPSWYQVTANLGLGAIVMGGIVTSTPSTLMTGTSPFTWATGDALYISGTYLAGGIY